MKVVKAGLVGFGTIGTGVAELLVAQSRMLELRTGIRVELTRIADVDVARPRGVTVPGAKLSTDFLDVVGDPDIDIVIELVGGTGVARAVVEGSLRAGKHVVTANKALLHEHGEELFQLATVRHRELHFEASVGGGIPIVRVIRESLASDRITALWGIVNGTTNFILTRMIQERWSFEAALKRAQELGFAESDPTLDVGGGDAAHKLDILATLAFNARPRRARVLTEGIDRIQLLDVLYAKELGYVVKLLAIAKLEDDQMSLRVHPTLIPDRCALASVSNEFNGIMLHSDFLGDSLYVGRGAGARPTATAVVADVLDLAQALSSGREFNPHRYQPFNNYETRSHLDIESRYYLRVSTLERPGVLAEITRILGEHRVSISALVQKEALSDGEAIPIVFLTRKARERDIRDAVAKIAALEVVRGEIIVLHVEDLAL